MPVLDNPRHERFAQLIAQGKTADDAYKACGYKPNHGNATRLKSNEVIRGRASELVTTAATKLQAEMVYSARTMFDRLSTIVDLAIGAKDYKTAGDNQRYLLKCMGYEDSPTMTHEHLRTGHSLAQQPPASPDGPPPRPRFAHAGETIRKARERLQ